MSFNDTLNQHIRLAILIELSRSSGYRSNESVLQGVVEKYGLTCSRDCMRTQITWCAEQGLVTVEDLGIMVPTLTQRGLDVSKGAAFCPGVQRPSPKG
jgi:hypothetical protein